MDYPFNESDNDFLEIESLCNKCRYIRKCPRIKSIDQKLDDLESESLGNWRMDLNLISYVSKCDLFDGVDDITIWVNGGDDFGRK